MLGSWIIEEGLGDVWLAPWLEGGRPPLGGTRIDPGAASRRVSLWFSGDALTSTVLVELARALDPGLGDRLGEDAPSLRARVIEALRDGRLVAYRVTRAAPAFSGALGEPKEAPPAPKTTDPREETTWIAIRLVDDDGEPVPFKRYRIELPNGERREGMLSEKGTARLEGIEPGTCEVSFPDFHATEWNAA